MKKYYIIILLSCILITLLLNTERCSNSIIKKEEKLYAISDIEAILYSNTIDTYLNQGRNLENVSVNYESGTFNLYDLINADLSKFIFVLPNNGCQKCIKYCEESIMVFLSDDLKKNKLIILRYGIEDDYSYKQALGINEYFMPEPFDIPLMKKNTPFFFVLDNSMKLNLLFIPDHRLKKQTEAFFSVVKKIWTPHEF